MSVLFHPDPAQGAQFASEKMGKSTLFRGEQMLVGLNAFEPGQEHAAHTHEGMDKLYQVVEGVGEFTIGEETQTLGRGALAVAPGGVVHSVRNTGSDRLIVLAVLAPAP